MGSVACSAERSRAAPSPTFKTITKPHCVRKSQIVSENSIFRKVQNSEFEFLSKKSMFLTIFKGKKYPNHLNFRAKNRDLDQKRSYKKLKIIEF